MPPFAYELRVQEAQAGGHLTAAPRSGDRARDGRGDDCFIEGVV